MKLGYLSPEGDFYECFTFGHLDLAKTIVNNLKYAYGESVELLTSIEAESYLLDLGWVCIRRNDIGHINFCSKKYQEYFNSKKPLINILSDRQLKFLNDIKDWNNLDQLDSATNVMSLDNMWRNALNKDDSIELNPRLIDMNIEI